MANSDKEVKNQKTISKEKQTQVEYSDRIKKYEQDILDISLKEAESKTKIKDLVTKINKAKGKTRENLLEELKLEKTKLDIMQREAKIKQSLADIGDDIVDKMDKEALLSYDIQANKKKLKKTNAEILVLEDKVLGLKGKEKEEMEEQIKIMKQMVFQGAKVHEINSKAANLAQQTQKLQDSVLGTLNLSVGALQGMVLGAKAFIKALMASPILFTLGAILASAALIFGQIVGGAKDFNENLGTSAGQSLELSKNLTVSRNALKLLGIDGSKVATDIVDNFGTLGSATDDNVYQIGEMQRMLGMASSDTARFAKSFTSLTGDTMGAALNMAEFAGSLAQSNDVAPGKVMADIASSTEEFAAYGKDGGKNIVEAAIAARKLGLELKTLTRISDTLLDFESSIQSEMEASMLIGKQLNYNKARELALQGDIAGAAQDVMKQVGGAAEFQKLNVIQRKKLAASIGVSVEEMSKLASGKLEIKDDKSEAEKNTDALRDLTSSQDKLAFIMKGLTAATIALTVAMTYGAVKDWLGNRGGKGSKGSKGSRGTGGSRSQTGLRNDGKWDRRTNVGKKGHNMDIRNKSFDKLKNLKNQARPGFFSRMGTNVSGLWQSTKGAGTSIMDKARNLKNPLSGGGGAKAMDFAGDMFSMKNMKGLLKKGKFSLGGIATGLLIDPIKNAFTEEGSVVNKMLSVADKTATYAGMGALGGAAAGAIGGPLAGVTGAGGGIAGGVLGFGVGMWEEFGGELKDWWSGESKAVEAASKANEEVIKKVAQVVQTGPMQGPPVPPAELTEVQKAQAAIAEKQAIFEAEQKAIAAEEEKRLLEERARLEEERQATLAAEKAILEQQLQLQDLNSKLEQARTNEANAKASIAKYLDPEQKQVLSADTQKKRMKMFERQLAQSQRNQDQLIAAIEKLNKTTANLADNS